MEAAGPIGQSLGPAPGGRRRGEACLRGSGSGSGRVRVVDVESLGADQLLGSGVAKAAVRWLGALRDVFLAELRAREVPDFTPYFPFVEMSFLAFWQKSSFLEKKRRFVDPSLFDRFLGQ